MSEQDRQGPQESSSTVSAYDRMLERVRTALDRAGDGAERVHEYITDAMERAVELGEVTREEGERVAAYLKRDMEDAGRFLAEGGQAFRDWLRFDMQLIEDRMLDMFARVADQTRLAQLQFAEQLRRASQYRTGEVTGIGTLRCVACGEEVHFTKTGRIPPCPACQATVFERVKPGGESEPPVDAGDE